MKTALTREMKKWLQEGERGISSETIFEILTGHCILSSRWGQSTPQDPSDFNRCYKLLNCVPEFRGRIKEVGERIPRWKPITDHWEELESLLCEEMKREDGMAPKLYKRLHELNGV